MWALIKGVLFLNPCQLSYAFLRNFLFPLNLSSRKYRRKLILLTLYCNLIRLDKLLIPFHLKTIPITNIQVQFIWHWYFYTLITQGLFFLFCYFLFLQLKLCLLIYFPYSLLDIIFIQLIWYFISFLLLIGFLALCLRRLVFLFGPFTKNCFASRFNNLFAWICHEFLVETCQKLVWVDHLVLVRCISAWKWLLCVFAPLSLTTFQVTEDRESFLLKLPFSLTILLSTFIFCFVFTFKFTF